VLVADGWRSQRVQRNVTHRQEGVSVGALNTAIRYLAIIAGGILVWSLAQQTHADTGTITETPSVAPYAVTHVCGTHVCGH
jgi:hypothetical protein